MPVHEYFNPGWSTSKSWLDQKQITRPVKRWHQKLGQVAARFSELIETPLEVPPTTPQPTEPTPTKA